MTAPRSVLPGLLADVRAGVADVTGVVDTIVHAAGRLAGALPPATAAAVREQVARMRRLERQVARRIGEALEQAGDPDALRAAGRAWASDVGGAVARVSDVLGLDRQRAAEHWRGAAADAYRRTLPPQRDALAAIGAVAGEIDAVLVELADAILRFWVSVAAALAWLVAAGLAAAAEAASVAGLPIATAAVLACLDAFVTFLDDAVDALTSATGTCRARAAALQQRLRDRLAFPGGAWPRSTTEPDRR